MRTVSLKNPYFIVYTANLPAVSAWLEALQLEQIGTGKGQYLYNNGDANILVKDQQMTGQRHTQIQLCYPLSTKQQYRLSSCNSMPAFDNNVLLKSGTQQYSFDHVTTPKKQALYHGIDHVVLDWPNYETAKTTIAQWCAEELLHSTTASSYIVAGLDATFFKPDQQSNTFVVADRNRSVKENIPKGWNHFAFSMKSVPGEILPSLGYNKSPTCPLSSYGAVHRALPSQMRQLDWHSDNSSIELDAAVYWNGENRYWGGGSISTLRSQTFISPSFNDGERDIRMQVTWRKPVVLLNGSYHLLPGDHLGQGLNTKAVEEWNSKLHR